MTHRDIELTNNAKNVLDAMPKASRRNAHDYLANPMLQEAADRGETLRLFSAGETYGTWMEVTLDEHARVDVQVWNLPQAWDSMPWPGNAAAFKARALPMTPNPYASGEFRRRQGVVSQMAKAAQRAEDSMHKETFAAMMESLAKYVPWVDQMTTLAHRVHGSAAGPHTPAQGVARAMNATTLFSELANENNARGMAWGCTTAQALLAVHASVHTEKNPGIYALDTPDGPATYLFVKPPYLKEDSNTVGIAVYAEAAGVQVWLDALGAPLFINVERQDGSDALVADLQEHPEPRMAQVEWMREGLRKQGSHDALDDWGKLMDEGFNDATRALCNRLASATPRALNHEEELDVVNRWLACPMSTADLWDNGVSLNLSHAHGAPTRAPTQAGESLRLWARYAARVWAQDNPTPHAMLDSLLPDMTRLDTIEAWRTYMGQMGPQGTDHPPEYIPLPGVLDVQDTSSPENTPLAW